MVNKTLVELAVQAMRKRRGGFLYIQSNVEDVAQCMRARVEDASCGELYAVTSEQLGQGRYKDNTEFQIPVSTSNTADVADVNSSLRQQRVADLQQLPTAVSTRTSWLTRSPLPVRARTETEAIYQQNAKPVYRTVFVQSSK